MWPDNWHTIYLLCRGCCFSPRPLEVQFLLSGQRLVSFVHIMSRHTNLGYNLLNVFQVFIYFIRPLWLAITILYYKSQYISHLPLSQDFWAQTEILKEKIVFNRCLSPPLIPALSELESKLLKWQNFPRKSLGSSLKDTSGSQIYTWVSYSWVSV